MLKAFGCVDHNSRKLLKDRALPDYVSPEKPVCKSRINSPGHGTTYWFRIGKGVCQGCILSPCLFNLYAEYLM